MESLSITDLHVNLLVLSKYREGNRLIVRGNALYTEIPWLLTPIKRLVLGDSRMSIVPPIRELYKRALIFLDKDDKSIDSNNLIQNIHRSLIGLNKLFSTYKSDDRFISELEEIKQTVSSIIEKYPLKDSEALNFIYKNKLTNIEIKE
jgi:hypothetical protein